MIGVIFSMYGKQNLSKANQNKESFDFIYLRYFLILQSLFLSLQIWASTQENLSSGVLEHQRCRPACTSVQTDQRLCYSFTGEYHN